MQWLTIQLIKHKENDVINLDSLQTVKSAYELDTGTHRSLKNDYVYFQISKSASSTVKYYLQALEVRGTKREVVDASNRYLSPHIWLSQLKEGHFLERLILPGVRKVTFVRNPFSRLLSCYLHCLKGSPDSTYEPC